MDKQELIELMEETWGEDEDCVFSLIDMIGDYDLIADILKHDRSFNRYTCCYDWSDLALEIINDPAFCDELEYTDYIKEISDALDKGEEAVKTILIRDNWAIDTDTGIAIGFDDDINVICHEVK